MGDELTGVRLGDEEENESPLHSETRDVDVLIFLVLQSINGKRVPDVNGREVDAGGSLRGLVELGLTTTLNVGARETLREKYPDLFRALFLAVFVPCIGFIGISLFAGCCWLFGRVRWFLSRLWLGGNPVRPARSLGLHGLSILSDFWCGFARHN